MVIIPAFFLQKTGLHLVVPIFAIRQFLIISPEPRILVSEVPVDIEKILIIDDSPVARVILRKCLPKERDYQVLEAGGGREGLELFKTEKPDLTFLDLTMPELDGFETLKLLRAENPTALIVVMTADRQRETAKRVMESGGSLITYKPAKPEQVKIIFSQISKLENPGRLS